MATNPKWLAKRRELYHSSPSFRAKHAKLVKARYERVKHTKEYRDKQNEYL